MRKIDLANIQIGLVDSDLIDGGTRHPNLVLLKIAGFLKDNGVNFKLIYDNDADVSPFYRIYVSKVFSFTKDPKFLVKDRHSLSDDEFVQKYAIGGTGNYSIDLPKVAFQKWRKKDMNALEKDIFLCRLKNHRGGLIKKGIDMARQMPYYDLYEDFIDDQVNNHGREKSSFKDYLYYSIGFLTRGCVRHCPFCVNKLENSVRPYSELDWFLDNSIDPETGKLKRPYIYLWDDNFLAADRSIWEPLLLDLQSRKRPFQFRQGLDERMLAERGDDGEVMAKLLTQSSYHGDYIFAFDNWRDREKIERALIIWNKYNVKHHPTKFYLFCGFKQESNLLDKFYRDVWELFHRIRVLMHYGCLGYVMRHADYEKAPIPNFYVQVARWCNQPAFYKKMSFWEFCYRNQSYWEENRGFVVKKKIISYEEYCALKETGYFKTEGMKICKPLKTVELLLDLFPERKETLLRMFNYKFSNMITIPEHDWESDPQYDHLNI